MHDILILGFYIIYYEPTKQNIMILGKKKHKHILQGISHIIHGAQNQICLRPTLAHNTVRFQQCTCKTQEKWCWNVNRAKQMKCLCLFHTPTKQNDVVLRALSFVHLNGEMIKAKDCSLILMAKKS